MSDGWKRRLDEVRNLPGHCGLVVHDLNTGEHYAFQETMPVVAASLIKVPIMIEAFARREAGMLSFDESYILKESDKLPSCGALNAMHAGLEVTIGDLVRLMIILSDNTATNILIDRLGMTQIQEQMTAIGMKDSHIRRKLFQADLSARGIENTVSAGDMANVLEGLYRHRIVSPSASEEMLSILLEQRLNGKIPFFLSPCEIPVAHKTGEDDGITHDAGIIYGKAPRVFCFVSEKTDVPAAERFIQDAAAWVGLEQDTEADG